MTEQLIHTRNANLAVIAAGARAELGPACVGATAMAAVALFYDWRFSGLGEPRLLFEWVAAMMIAPAGVVLIVIVQLVRRPDGAECVRAWRPFGRGLRLIFSLAVIASPWIFLPLADGPMLALMLMLYVWFLAALVFANNDPGGMTWVALVGVPLSVGLCLLYANIPYALPLTLFLLAAGATIFNFNRLLRRNRLTAEAAHLKSARAAAKLQTQLAERAIAESGAFNLDATVTNLDPPARATLTPRQVEVARLLALGLSNKEIARQLDISPAMVKTHVAQVIAVIGARNRTGASARAKTMGLL